MKGRSGNRSQPVKKQIDKPLAFHPTIQSIYFTIENQDGSVLTGLTGSHMMVVTLWSHSEQSWCNMVMNRALRSSGCRLWWLWFGAIAIGTESQNVILKWNCWDMLVVWWHGGFLGCFVLSSSAMTRQELCPSLKDGRFVGTSHVYPRLWTQDFGHDHISVRVP